jgi:Uma2 family endonuclease
MAVSNVLLTVDEFSRLPQPAGGVRQELHHGEVVELPPRKLLHALLQNRLAELLRSCMDAATYLIGEQFPFRALPEYEVREADVAVVHRSALKGVVHEDYFRGVQVVVIEVLSASNTASEMLDREELCLRNGGEEFWVVDPKRETVKVTRATGFTATYHVDDVLRSDVLSAVMAVREIFIIPGLS